MALRRRGFVSVGAVVACCALAAACSPDQAPASTPSPTPAATTPAESQIERQMRLDYEAAEKAYRANMQSRTGCIRQAAPSKATPHAQGNRYRLLPTDQSSSRFAMSTRRAGMRPRNTESWGSCETAAGRSDRVGLTSCEDNESRQICGRIGRGRYSGGTCAVCPGTDRRQRSADVGRSRRP